MRITIIRNRARPVLLSLLVAAALVAVTATAAFRLGGGTEQAAAQADLSVSLDMDTTDGPCTDIDSSASHATGDIYSVAICVTGLDGEPMGAIGVMSFDVLYDDTLNIAPDVATHSTNSLDDNPDANAGNTIWGDGLGPNFDCSSGGLSYPSGDANAATGPGNGDAFISCMDVIAGPWTLGDNETSGVLAVISFAAVAPGADTMAIANGIFADKLASEIGSCNPSFDYPMTCNGASETNQGAPVPVPTPPPGPITTPPVLPPAEETPLSPPPIAPPPIGGTVPSIVAPPTGSGPAAGGSPWTAMGGLLAGAAGAAIAAGGLLRIAKGRQR